MQLMEVDHSWSTWKYMALLNRLNEPRNIVGTQQTKDGVTL